MPGGYPLGLELCNGTDQGTVTASSIGTSVTGGSANVVGSWTQLVASSAIDCCWMLVTLADDPSSGVSWAVDIGVGAAASEVVVAQQLMHFANGAKIEHSTVYSFPCSIPKGTRISARLQASTGSDIHAVQVTLFDGAFTMMEGAAGVDAIGFQSASTLGAQLDPGGTANTKGAYTQLVASTARDYMGLMLYFDPQAAGAGGNSTLLVDIAVGAAASEVVIIPNLGVSKNTVGATYLECAPDSFSFLPVPIPAGTRLSARCQCTNNTATARLIGATAYGVYQ